jgi:hypothetical protein
MQNPNNNNPSYYQLLKNPENIEKINQPQNKSLSLISCQNNYLTLPGISSCSSQLKSLNSSCDTKKQLSMEIIQKVEKFEEQINIEEPLGLSNTDFQVKNRGGYNTVKFKTFSKDNEFILFDSECVDKKYSSHENVKLERNDRQGEVIRNKNYLNYEDDIEKESRIDNLPKKYKNEGLSEEDQFKPMKHSHRCKEKIEYDLIKTIDETEILSNRKKKLTCFCSKRLKIFICVFTLFLTCLVVSMIMVYFKV